MDDVNILLQFTVNDNIKSKRIDTCQLPRYTCVDYTWCVVYCLLYTVYPISSIEYGLY